MHSDTLSSGTVVVLVVSGDTQSIRLRILPCDHLSGRMTSEEPARRRRHAECTQARCQKASCRLVRETWRREVCTCAHAYSSGLANPPTVEGCGDQPKFTFTFTFTFTFKPKIDTDFEDYPVPSND